MPGKLKIAAGMLLGTTVLAAAGTVAYYGASGDWPWARLGTQEEPAAGEAFDEPADLDAVASAWAEPFAAEVTSPSDASEIARSADVTLARAEQPIPADVARDRYAVYPSAPPDTQTYPNVPPRTPAYPSTPPQAESFEPGATVDVVPETEVVPPADIESGEVDTAEPAHAAEYDGPSVARGQEPVDGTIELIETLPDATQADDGELGATNERQEPNTLDLSADEPTRNTAARRARRAFREQPSPTAGDRYGAAAASRNSALPAGNNATMVNPFAATPSAGAATPAASQPMQGLSTLPAENESNWEELPQSVGEPSFASQSVPNELHPLDSARNNAGATMEGTGRPGEKALEGPQKPALLIQKFAPGEIQVGKPAKFVIQIRNVGTQAADNVVLRDEVPQGTRLVSTTPSATANGNQLVWQLGKLSAGEERKLEMQLMPLAEGEVGSVATVSYSAQASVKTRCTMPQLAIRMTAPDKVMIGQEQRVKIELRNPGSGDATGVMLFENVPENVKHAAGPALEFEIGTLRAGETRELELSLSAEKAGKVINVLTARADGNLQVQQQVEFEVIAPALAVMVAGPERRYLERPATYEVSVENPGTAPALDVQIVTKLPKGMRFVRANNMGEYDAASHAVYWSLTELPEGESGTVELVTMPVETGTQTIEVESRAGQGLSDQAKRQILVEGLAAIMFEVRDLEDPIEVGRETGYEIRVVNQGTKAASNVQVAVALPPGMKLVSAEGETAHATQGANIIFEPLPKLAPKADTVYQLRVQGIQAGDQRVMVQVNTDDLGPPIRREESTRVFGDE